MIAKRLENLLADATQLHHSELVQRFQNLRDFGVLPKSRGRNAEELSSEAIASGILSIVSDRPGFAGTSAIVLQKLRPVGGVSASYAGCGNFLRALVHLIEDEQAIENLVEIRISDSEIYTNCYGRGVIVTESERTIKQYYYVGETAISLLQPYAEKDFKPRSWIRSSIKETTILPTLLERIRREEDRRRQYEKSIHQPDI